jgi:hypothetical protein
MELASLRNRDGRRAGSALVIAMVTISGLAVASMTLIQYSLAVDRERTDGTSEAHAHYLAESGLHEAATSILFGDTGSLGSEAAPIAFADGVFWTVATDLGDDMWSIRSTAMAGKGRHALEAVVELVPRGNVETAVFSGQRLTLDKGIFSDSYDSALGSYASQATNDRDGVQYAGTRGDIGSGDDLSIKNGAEVFGNVLYGPGDELKAQGKALDGVSGEALESDLEPNYPAVSAPAAGPSLGQVHLHGDSGSTDMDLVIGPGVVRYDSLTIHSDAQVKLVGPLTLVVDDAMKLDAELDVDATNGQVALFVGQSLKIRKQAEVNVSTGSAADFLVLVGTQEDKQEKVKSTKVTVDGPFTGVIYAPHSKVEVRQNAEIFGALIGDAAYLQSGARIHFDEALIRMESELVGEPRLRLISLRTVEFDAAVGASDRRDPLALLRLDPDELTSIDRSWTIGGSASQREKDDKSSGKQDSSLDLLDELWPTDGDDPTEDWDALEKH